jgi:preprotein translocase subunit SecA
MMTLEKWKRGWQRRSRVEEPHLDTYRRVSTEVSRLGASLRQASDTDLRHAASALRQRGTDEPPDILLPEAFALTREVAHRILGLRPFDVQVVAAVALAQGALVEMQTGEGKTLAAVLPAALHALAGRGVHVLTVNDYLARRDARWMGPVYEALGLSVGVIQEGMQPGGRRAAYAADVTYATAKEVGFDVLRDGLARAPHDLVQRSFHVAIVDEADSILIDEARVPLVIAGARERSNANPYQIAAVVGALSKGADWATDEHDRNVQLTDRGIDRIEAELGCGSLHDPVNDLLLAEVNQALHARVLLHRDVDYLVRDGRIALVDEFTGRVVADRRWPDGLQAALEAKEGVAIQPGGQILGSITLPHVLAHYPTLAGMTATAQPAADEVAERYGLHVVPIPPNRPCIREDLPDLLFTHREAKERALVREIAEAHSQGRPVLVGTSSVAESERLASTLAVAGVPCRVLNAKHDEAEAKIIAGAGALGAVTISTNMAGRGTDIRLGGADEADRDRVVALSGLYVIGTNRHESRRIDDQLRGRSGRQGDPGTSRFFTSLDDPLLVRFGIDSLLPPRFLPEPQDAPLDHPAVLREIERLQRIVEGQNRDIRSTLARYSALVEKQRATLAEWRRAILKGEADMGVFRTRLPERYATWSARVGAERLEEAESAVLLHHIDAVWAEHLAFVAEVREGVHLVGVGGLDPLHEFHRQIGGAFRQLHQEIEDRTVETLSALNMSADGRLGLDLQGPSSTWTYLVDDRALTELQQMLFGHGSGAFSAAAALMTWPLLFAWGIRRRWFSHPEER